MSEVGFSLRQDRGLGRALTLTFPRYGLNWECMLDMPECATSRKDLDGRLERLLTDNGRGSAAIVMSTVGRLDGADADTHRVIANIAGECWLDGDDAVQFHKCAALFDYDDDVLTAFSMPDLSGVIAEACTRLVFEVPSLVGCGNAFAFYHVPHADGRICPHFHVVSLE